MVQLNFDANQVEPDAGMDVVPAGWYNVAVDETEMKPTKGGDGAYLKFRFTILDGQYHGRKLFINLNIRNPNPQTVEIAQRQLSAICHATGVLNLQDTQQLYGIPLKVKVSVRKDPTGQYEDQNDIKSFKNINEQVDMAGGPTPPAQSGFGNAGGNAGFNQGGAGFGGGQPQGGQPQGGNAGFGGGQQQQQQQQQQPPQQQQQGNGGGYDQGPWNPNGQGGGQQQQPQQQQQQQQPDQSQQGWDPNQAGSQPWQNAPQGNQNQGGQQQGGGQQQQQQQQQHPAQSANPPWQQ